MRSILFYPTRNAEWRYRLPSLYNKIFHYFESRPACFCSRFVTCALSPLHNKMSMRKCYRIITTVVGAPGVQSIGVLSHFNELCTNKDKQTKETLNWCTQFASVSITTNIHHHTFTITLPIIYLHIVIIIFAFSIQPLPPYLLHHGYFVDKFDLQQLFAKHLQLPSGVTVSTLADLLLRIRSNTLGFPFTPDETIGWCLGMFLHRGCCQTTGNKA